MVSKRLQVGFSLVLISKGIAMISYKLKYKLVLMLKLPESA